MAQNAVTISSVGMSAPILMRDINAHPASLGIGVLVTLSAGAGMTYNVIVTGDNTHAAGYNQATGNWNIFDGMGGLTTSANGTLVARVSAIALQITSYTSGTANLAVVQ